MAPTGTTCGRRVRARSPREKGEAIGVAQWNVHLMAGDEKRTLDVYGQEIVPAF